MSPVARFLDRVRQLKSSGLDMKAAVRVAANQDRALTVTVLETIGSWPSSEPELRELQRNWP